MSLEEKADWFAKYGIAHVLEEDVEEFIRLVSSKGLSYKAPYDSGLKVYVFMLEESINV